MVRKFEFKKAFEEIEIAGRIYRFKTDDDSLFRYRDQLTEHGKKLTAIGQKQGLSEEDIHKKSLVVFRDFIKTIFDEDCFDSIYEASGRSVFGLTDLVEFIADVVEEKLNERKRKERDLKNRRNRHKKTRK